MVETRTPNIEQGVKDPISSRLGDLCDTKHRNHRVEVFGQTSGFDSFDRPQRLHGQC